MDDEARVKAFMDTWGLEADGIREDLLALLRGSTPPPTTNLFSPEWEAQLAQALSEVAPKDADWTPALEKEVRARLASIVETQLVACGMPPAVANLLGAFVSGMANVRKKND